MRRFQQSDIERGVLRGYADVTDEVATSGSAQAQTSEVHDRLVLTPVQAAWLRDVLIVMRLDASLSEFEVAVAERRLADNPLAAER